MCFVYKLIINTNRILISLAGVVKTMRGNLDLSREYIAVHDLLLEANVLIFKPNISINKLLLIIILYNFVFLTLFE